MQWRHQSRIIANRERKHPCQTLAHNLHTAMALNNNLEFLWHKSLQELQEIWSRRDWSVRRTMDIWRAQNEATRLGVYVPENISRDGLIDLLNYFSKGCVLKTSPSSRRRMAGAEMGLYTTSHTGQYKTWTVDHELRTGYNTRTSTSTLTSIWKYNKKYILGLACSQRGRGYSRQATTSPGRQCQTESQAEQRREYRDKKVELRLMDGELWKISPPKSLPSNPVHKVAMKVQTKEVPISPNFPLTTLRSPSDHESRHRQWSLWEQLFWQVCWFGSVNFSAWRTVPSERRPQQELTAKCVPPERRWLALSCSFENWSSRSSRWGRAKGTR